MLTELQTQIEEILAADSVFAQEGITVVAIDKGDALALVTEAVAAAGTAVAIAPPSADFSRDSSIGPVSDGGVRIVVQILESPGLSRAQGLPSAVSLAERLAWLLHSCNHPDRQDDTPLGVMSIRPVPDPDLLVIEITLAASGTIADPDATEEEA
jgi:hypothetical protein